MRVDMFDVEIESLRWFSTFTQRSLGDVQEVEIAPAAELAVEHRELAAVAGEQIAAGGAGFGAGENGSESRPDIAELLPVGRFGALLDLIGEGTELVVAAEEELAPALSDHWSDVCAAFGDEDAHHLYVSPEAVQASVSERARIWLSAISSGQELELRAQSADTAARSLAEAEPELEKLVRSGYRTVVAFPRRGEGERAAYNLGRLKASWLGEGVDAGSSPQEPSLRFAAASLREGFVAPQLKLAVFPEHRLLRRRRAERGGVDASETGGRRGARRGALRSFSGAARGRHRRARGPRRGAVRRLRDAHRGGRHARLPVPRIPGRRPRVRAHRPAGEDLALRRRGRREPAAEQAGRHALGDDEGARQARRAGAGGRAAEPVRRAPPAQRARLRGGLRLAARVRGGGSRSPRRRTSARRSSWSRRTWRRRGRWTG